MRGKKITGPSFWWQDLQKMTLREAVNLFNACTQFQALGDFGIPDTVSQAKECLAAILKHFAGELGTLQTWERSSLENRLKNYSLPGCKLSGRMK